MNRKYRKTIIAGNWKMNKTPGETKVFAERLKSALPRVKRCSIVLCVPFVDIPAAVKILKDSRVAVGAQNLHWQTSGPFTGEVSAAMLAELDVKYVIIGHSERRTYFGDTDITVQNGDVGTALLSDELWKLLGANSNPLAADYTMRMVKLIRSQGGVAGVTSQGMADMMALDGGKYGKGILDSCRIKFIMQMEDQEARLVQNILNLTEEETKMITRFRRGEGLLCIGHNHVPIAIHVSPREYEAITTSPTDLRARNTVK